MMRTPRPPPTRPNRNGATTQAANERYRKRDKACDSGNTPAPPAKRSDRPWGGAGSVVMRRCSARRGRAQGQSPKPRGARPKHSRDGVQKHEPPPQGHTTAAGGARQRGGEMHQTPTRGPTARWGARPHRPCSPDPDSYAPNQGIERVRGARAARGLKILKHWHRDSTPGRAAPNATPRHAPLGTRVASDDHKQAPPRGRPSHALQPRRAQSQADVSIDVAPLPWRSAPGR